jgi:hypothetical protein
MVSKRFQTGVTFTGALGVCVAGFLLLGQQKLFESFMVFSQSLILMMTLRGLLR